MRRCPEGNLEVWNPQLDMADIRARFDGLSKERKRGASTRALGQGRTRDSGQAQAKADPVETASRG